MCFPTRSYVCHHSLQQILHASLLNSLIIPIKPKADKKTFLQLQCYCVYLQYALLYITDCGPFTRQTTE